MVKRAVKLPSELTGQMALCDPGASNFIPARLDVMHRMYGDYAGHQCGDCQHFTRFRSAGGHKSWAKCDLTVDSGGPGSDWKARWTACGRFVEARD